MTAKDGVRELLVRGVLALMVCGFCLAARAPMARADSPGDPSGAALPEIDLAGPTALEIDGGNELVVPGPSVPSLVGARGENEMGSQAGLVSLTGVTKRGPIGIEALGETSVQRALGQSGCAEAMVNGGFELGSNVGWKLDSNGVDPDTRDPIGVGDVVVHDATVDGLVAVEGDWVAFMGRGTGIWMTLWQETPVPTVASSRLRSATLTYYVGMISDEYANGTSDDWLGPIFVDQDNEYVFVPKSVVSEEVSGLEFGYYYELEFDVTDLVRRRSGWDSFRVGFRTEQDDALTSIFLVDGVRLEICESGAAPSPTPSRIDQSAISVQLGRDLALSRCDIDAGTRYQHGIDNLCVLVRWSNLARGTPLRWQWYLGSEPIAPDASHSINVSTSTGCDGTCIIARRDGVQVPLPEGAYKVEVWAGDISATARSRWSASASIGSAPVATSTPRPRSSATPRPTRTTRDTSGLNIYLPVGMKNWPPVPAVPSLKPIDNQDGNGSYSVSWASAARASRYVLQEATNPAFANARQVYSGRSRSWTASDKDLGAYYYRVKAVNSHGESLWSAHRLASVFRAQIVASADTAVIEHAVRNVGDLASLWIGYHQAPCFDYSGHLGQARSYLRFDLSRIPSRANIRQATLLVDPLVVCWRSDGPRTYWVHRATSSWSEDGVMWGNRPAHGEPYDSVTKFVARGDDNLMNPHYYNVTGLVRKWFRADEPNHGLVLVGPEGKGDKFSILLVASSEYGGSAMRPQLDVVLGGLGSTALDDGTAPLTALGPTRPMSEAPPLCETRGANSCCVDAAMESAVADELLDQLFDDIN